MVIENLAAPGDELRKRLSSLFTGMMKSLFKEHRSEFRVELVADPAVQEFVGAHASALDSAFQKVEMSDAMRRRLTRSNYIFSGMKAFHELHEAFPSLLDENGNRKPFERFLNDVQSIDKTYNSNYLRAEYNFVAASAEMAGRWEQFMRDGDRYNLQYRTQRDDKVRPEHAALDRVTLPPSDSFWEEFYPPNGWNCRCTVVQVRKSKYPATSHDEAMRLGDEALQRDTKGIFRFNPGLEQKTVPDYNPYTIRKCNTCPVAKGGKGGALAAFIPDNEMCAACRWIHKCELRDSLTKKGNKIPVENINQILSMSYDEQFIAEYRGFHGVVYQHLLHCTANVDNQFVLDVAKAFADIECDCWINPVVRESSPYRRNFYHDLPLETRCNPDLKTSLFGYVDVKSPTQPHTWVRNAIHASSKQYSCVCLTNHRTPITEEEIEQRTRLVWKDPHYKHDYLFWFIDGVLRKYKRP